MKASYSKIIAASALLFMAVAALWILLRVGERQAGGTAEVSSPGSAASPEFLRSKSELYQNPAALDIPAFVKNAESSACKETLPATDTVCRRRRGFTRDLSALEVAAGETLRVDWPHNAFGKPVKFQYSTDGRKWLTAAEGLSKGGSYDWTVPDDLAGRRPLVRVTDGRESIQAQLREILSPRPASLAIVHPAAGETVRAGAVVGAVIKAAGSMTGDELVADFSSDGGLSWVEGVGRGSAADGFVAWKTPEQPTDSGVLRIKDKKTGKTLAETESGFKVAEAAPPVFYNDDPYEENDDLESAYEFSNFTVTGVFPAGLYLYDEDYYKVTAPEDGTLTVSISFDHEACDMNLTLFKNGSKVAYSDISTADSGREDLSIIVSDNDVVVVMVAAATPNGEDYDLVVRMDDAFEGSGNDTLAAPADLGTLSGTFGSKTTAAPSNGLPLDNLLLADDTDVYSFSLPPVNAGFKLMCVLDERPYGDSFKLELFDESNMLLDSSEKTGTADERVVLDISASTVATTTYKLRITRSSFGGFADYGLAFYADDAYDDEASAGDDTESSAPLVTPPFSALERRCFDNDCLRLNLNSGAVQVIIEHDATEGNLNLRLSDTAGTELDSAGTDKDVEVVEYDVQSAGVYYLMVSGAFGERNPSYSLRVRQEDSYDSGGSSNDNRAEADVDADLGTVGYSTGSDLSISGLFCNDPDYFRVTCGDKDQRLYAEIRYQPLAGGLKLTVQSASGSAIAASQRGCEDSGYERVAWDASAGSVYYLSITRTGDHPTGYELVVAADDADDDPAGTENDSQNDATDLFETYGLANPGAGELQEVTLTDRVCIDEDWYRIHYPRGGRIAFQAKFDASLGDINMFLYDYFGQLIASSANTHDLKGGADDVEEFVVWVDPGQDFALKILPASQHVYGGNSNYTLEASLDDYQEPNNSFAQAWQLLPGEHPNLRLYDEDWFYVVAPASGVMVIYADNFIHDAAENDLKLELYDQDGTLITSSNGAGNEETLMFSAESGKVYVFAVIDAGTSPTRYDHFADRYDLLVQMDDSWEENDEYSMARALEAGDRIENLWHFDDDWFGISVPSGRELAVSIAFTHSAGNLALDLYDSSGTPLGHSDGTGDVESVTVQAYTSNRDVYIRVSGVTNSRPYTITANYEDGYEDNDTSANASVIAVRHLYQDLYHASGDDDWYSFTPDASGTWIIFARHDNALGDISAELFENDGTTLVGSSDTTNGLEKITFTAVQGTTYRLKISGEANPDYELSVWQDDSDEENDDSSNSAAISDGYKRLLDEDWFTTGALTTTDNYRVYLSFDNEQGDVNLQVYKSDGTTLVGESCGDTDTEFVIWTGFAGETYLVRVFTGAGDFNPSYYLDYQRSGEKDNGLSTGHCRLSETNNRASPAALLALAAILLALSAHRRQRHQGHQGCF